MGEFKSGGYKEPFCLEVCGEVYYTERNNYVSREKL